MTLLNVATFFNKLRIYIPQLPYYSAIYMQTNQIESDQQGLNEETQNLLEHFLDDVDDNGSMYLKIQDGQSVQLTINLKTTDTGYKERAFEKNGEELKRFNFAVYNHKAGRDQIWEISNRWPKRALSYDHLNSKEEWQHNAEYRLSFHSSPLEK